MTEAVLDTNPPAAAAAPAAVAAPAPAAATPTAPAAPAAPASPAAPAPSLLAKGAAASPAQPAADAPASPIPAKYQVKTADGKVDVEASMAKWSEGHSNLEKRLGGGDAPPATPEDYAPTLPQGLTMETLKADPLFSGFLKGAHARGMSNADVSFVLESYQARMALANSPEAGEAQLRKDWVTDDQMERGLAESYRAVAAFTNGDKDRMARIEAKFGNDPDFVWLTAQIGKELQEDTSVQGGLTGGEQQTLESLMASPAYMDGKHADHARVVAQVQTLYTKRYGAR